MPYLSQTDVADVARLHNKDPEFYTPLKLAAIYRVPVGAMRDLVGMITAVPNDSVRVDDLDAGWTPARVSVLRSCWEEGMSAAKIAARLGNVTRNGVVSKLHRLGLRGGGNPSAQERPRRALVAILLRNRLDGRARAPGLAPEMPLPDGAPTPKRKTLFELRKRDCRWPYGDPLMPDFHFCAHEVRPGFSWCPFHYRMAFLSAEGEDDVADWT